jgi:chromosomal replication initiation ATPase DnaA
MEIIIEETSRFFKLKSSDITKPLRGERNIPRLLSMHLSRKMGLFTYARIGYVFNRTTYAASSALKRLEERLKHD